MAVPRYVICRPELDKETEASHMSPLTDILKPDAGPFQSPGNAWSAADTLGLANLIVDP